jgi:peptidyl-prolyl cis-trans isomerase SurA
VRALAGLAVASAVLLTGCGAVPDLNPGVAVRVDDESLTTRDVATTATDYCAASTQSAQQGQTVANHYINGLVVGSFALRTAADHVLAAQGVTVDPSYQAAIDSAEESLSKLSADEREALIQVGASSIYVQAAELSIGRAVLGGSPSDADAQAAGHKEVTGWLDDHELRIDPRYGVTIQDGELVPDDTSVSVALSETAVQADAARPDATYAATLPSTQRCG